MQQKIPAGGLAEKMRRGCVGTRVGRLHRLVGRRFDESLRPLGLSIPQMEILSALTLIAEPIKPSALAELLGMERSTMSRNLAAMEDRGWIAPMEMSATGRSMTVAITEEGSAKLESADEAWSDAQAALVEAMGPDVTATIDNWLDQLIS